MKNFLGSSEVVTASIVVDIVSIYTSVGSVLTTFADYSSLASF